MKISERAQHTIPKRSPAKHPVETISGILDGGIDIDRYIEEIRGR